MRVPAWSLLLWAVGCPSTGRGAETKAQGVAEAETFGPRAGRFGVRAVLLGNSLTPSVSVVPTLGARLFVSDAVAVGTRVGVGVLWGHEPTQTGYELGLGLSIYGWRSQGRLHPFFDTEATFIHSKTEQATRKILVLTAGAGLEHWLAAMVSTSVVLRVGIARNFTDGTYALGTINPGLIVTVYAN